MSDSNQNLLDIAAQAEQDLSTHAAKTGSNKNASDSTTESGIDQSVTTKFPGSTAEYGSHTSGAGDNRDIPESEGGGVQRGTGRLTKAGDFEGGEVGEGPEDVARRVAGERGGEDGVVDAARK